MPIATPAKTCFYAMRLSFTLLLLVLVPVSQ
jgi:hypothetical protein